MSANTTTRAYILRLFETPSNSSPFSSCLVTCDAAAAKDLRRALSLTSLAFMFEPIDQVKGQGGYTSSKSGPFQLVPRAVPASDDDDEDVDETDTGSQNKCAKCGGSGLSKDGKTICPNCNGTGEENEDGDNTDPLDPDNDDNTPNDDSADDDSSARRARANRARAIKATQEYYATRTNFIR